MIVVKEPEVLEYGSSRSEFEISCCAPVCPKDTDGCCPEGSDCGGSVTH